MKNRYEPEIGIQWYHVLGVIILIVLTLIKCVPALMSSKILWPVGIISALLLLRSWLLDQR